MRAFLSSCLVLAVILTCTACNHVYLERTTDALYACACALPETPEDEQTRIVRTEELQRVWRERRPILSLTVPASRLERIDLCIDAVSAPVYACADTYISARSNLFLYLTRLRQTELFSWQGLL